MPVTFDTLTIANYSKEFPSKTAFRKERCNICLNHFGRLKGNAEILVHEGKGTERHAHHVECLTPWLEQKQSCPCCRKDNLLPMRQEALVIFKKITLNGLGSGLLIGALAYLNNTVHQATLSSNPFAISLGNNTLLYTALGGGMIQSSLTAMGRPNDFTDIERLLLSFICSSTAALSSAYCPPLSICAATAVTVSNIATVALLKWGASPQGLLPPMIIAAGLSAITSSHQSPVPSFPLAAISIIFGSIGAMKNKL